MLFYDALRHFKSASPRRRANRARGRSLAARGRAKYQPSLEAIESRTLLSAVSWVGTNGDWDTPSNWSTGVVPGPGDDVTINVSSPITITHSSGNYDQVHSLTISNANDTLSISNGTLSLTAASTLSGPLNLTGGTLTGTGNITVSGPMTWSNAAINGDATLNANGGLTINGTSVNESMDARTLNINGNAIWSGSNNIYLMDAAAINIKSGVTFTAQAAANLYWTGGLDSVINNAGTFVESAGSGNTTTIGEPFNNTGTVNVSTGILNLNNGGTASGAFTVASGAVLQFDSNNNPYRVGSTSSISGAGSVNFLGGSYTALIGPYTVTGTTTVNGNVNFVTNDSMPTLNLQGGTLTGSGALTVTGTMNWSGGAINGQGSVTIPTGGTLNIDGGNTSESLVERTFNIAGTANWSNTNNLSMGAGATINILSGGNFNITNDQNIYYNGNGTVAINNAGTVTVTAGSGTSTLNSYVEFNNTGTVNVSTGALDLSGGGTASSGTLATAAGATLEFGNLVYAVEPGASINNAGTVAFSGGNSYILGPYSGSGTVDVNGGYGDFVNNATITTLNVTAGTLDGGGALTVTGSALWTNSTIAGTANSTLVIPSGVTLTVNGTNVNEGLSGRTINVSGTVAWSGSNNLYVSNGAAMNFLSGSAFTITNDQNIYNNGGNTPSITMNASSTLTATAGSGTINIDIPLNNAGTVNVASGTLSLNAGGTDNGAWTPASGATLAINGGTYLFNTGTSITGAGGTVVVNSGFVQSSSNLTLAGMTLDLNGGEIYGPSTITIGSTSSPSTMNWTGGTMGGSGATVITGGTTPSTLNITGVNGNVFIDTRTLTNSGTINWTGGNLYMSSGSILNNKGTFNVNNNQNISYNGGNTPVVNNSKTMTVTAGSGAVTIGVEFNNTNTVTVSSGTLVLTAGGESTKTFSVASGATLEFASGNASLSSTSAITGKGNVTFAGGNTYLAGKYTATGVLTVNGGYVEFDGAATITVATFNLTGGYVGGVEAFSITSAFNWTNATLGDTSTVTIGSAATMTISGASVNEGLAYTNLVNSGTATWTGTNNLYVSNGAVLNNKGTFNVGTSGTPNDQNIYYSSGNTPYVSNSGTFTVNAGTGQFSIDIPYNNSGTSNVASGSWVLNAGGTNSKTETAASDATLDYNNGRFTNTTGSSVGGAGMIEVSGNGDLEFLGNDSMPNLSVVGGALTTNTALTVTSTMTWYSSTINGLGSITIPTGAVLNINGSSTSETIDYTTLNIAGTANWSSSNNIYIRDGATINVLSGGNFNIQNDQSIYYNGGNSGVINVAGTLTKSPTTGTSYLNTYLNVASGGVVNVSSGTLQVDAGTATGTFNVASGATLDFPTGDTYMFPSTSSLTGAGNLEVDNGTVIIDGSDTLTGTTSVTNGSLFFDSNATFPTLSLTGGLLSGQGNLTVTGTMTWQNSTIGGIGGTGTLTVSPGGTLNINGTSVNESLDGKTLNLAGTTNWSSTNNIILSDGATVNNESGATFNISNDQNIYYNGNVKPHFNNAGTLNVAAGSGTSTINGNVEFNNTGTVNVTTGTFALAGGGNGAGTYAVSSGATLDIAGGIYSIGSISGSGSLLFSGGNTVITGTVTGTNTVNVSGGTLTFLGNAATGAFTISSGSVAITTGTTLALSGAFTESGGQTDLQNATMTLPSGSTLALTGGTFDGTGTISAPSNNFTFNNSGGTLYVASYYGASGGGSVGTLNIDGQYTQGSSGTLVLYVGGASAGQFSVLNVAGAATLAGTLDVYGVGGYTPPVGTKLVIITYGSLSGTFGTVNVNINGHGGTLTYSSTSVTLTTT